MIRLHIDCVFSPNKQLRGQPFATSIAPTRAGVWLRREAILLSNSGTYPVSAFRIWKHSPWIIAGRTFQPTGYICIACTFKHKLFGTALLKRCSSHQVIRHSTDITPEFDSGLISWTVQVPGCNFPPSLSQRMVSVAYIWNLIGWCLPTKLYMLRD